MHFEVAHATFSCHVQAQKARQQKQLQEGGPRVRQLAGEVLQFRGANMAEVAAFVRNIRQRLPAEFTETMLRQVSTQHRPFSICTAQSLAAAAPAKGEPQLVRAAGFEWSIPWLTSVYFIEGRLARGALGSLTGGGSGVARSRRHDRQAAGLASPGWLSSLRRGCPARCESAVHRSAKQDALRLCNSLSACLHSIHVRAPDED